MLLVLAVDTWSSVSFIEIVRREYSIIFYNWSTYREDNISEFLRHNAVNDEITWGIESQ